MASALVHRISKIASRVALCAIVIAVTAFSFGMTQRLPEARAAADRQLNEEFAQESRVACEKWEMRAGTEEYTACIAELKEIRAKQDKRRANDPGNRRDGLAVLL
jgi:hypothetical protein